MQSKILAALFFSTLALAAPAPQETSDSYITNPEFDADSAAAALSSIPNSILTVLATAVPASWYADLADPASLSSINSEIEAGTMPAWYNQLPASVKAWATSAGELGLTDATTTASASASASATSAPSAATDSASTTSGSTGSVAVQTTAVSTSSVSTSTSTAASGSVSPSSTAASSTSTGGAPIATGSIAMSFAGAISLLGLVVAL
ncbi:hypothetical protein PENDEC_c016G02215 [Penicillium decumbens]|uniref:Uncharacterized protein n=1 Tax=Penicillium decumbens TaxID=69771 RepID=A0A1V6P8B2_PENDC|nr:hypothetical protein PENDEC_c016G02215 [Penicillium decumbens]